MLSNSSILVLGAGELGMAVLRGLAARRKDDQSSDLAVLLRPESIHSADSQRTSMIEELRSLDIQLVAGDLQKHSEADLASIFQPFRTVIGCTGFAAGSQVQLKIARAVLTAEIERFVPWQFGVDYDVIGKGSSQELFDEQLEVRKLLRAQHGTDWLIISTGMFTSFLFEPSFGVVDLGRGRVHALGSWANAVTVTTAEDIGRLTAAILHTEPLLKIRWSTQQATQSRIGSWPISSKRSSAEECSANSGQSLSWQPNSPRSPPTRYESTDLFLLKAEESLGTNIGPSMRRMAFW